ncbi:type II toxin-antitoxin system RelE/ParE family toxin [Endozoicomonas sp. 4G]|uniref:type II toxin-antitoxin system RelE/ParE family toxin n=1 Tax=Endozoicomonas sp. 4G TaxID=2872754 RepID=UPI002078DDE3|nr:type II toxin-antitoxin system RelE/ParE family toxin [Endozoicomonas sp. 4G]
MKYEIIRTREFDRWESRLKDRQVLRAITMRLARAEAGNLGDVRSVGGNISEMRIFVGKGYRLYFTVRGGRLIILLCGGDKSSQPRDIETAREILQNLEE